MGYGRKMIRSGRYDITSGMSKRKLKDTLQIISIYLIKRKKQINYERNWKKQIFRTWIC